MLLVVAENRRNLLDVVNPHQIDKLAAGYCLREQVNNTMRRRLARRPVFPYTSFLVSFIALTSLF